MRSIERKPLRYIEWNYSHEGYYFVTICTQNRRCDFGEIKNGIMVLNEWGFVANACWMDIPNHFKNVELDEFVVMPNHVHGIIIVHESDNDIGPLGNGTVGPIRNVGDRHACPLRPMDRHAQKIPNIVGSFKSAVTKQINFLNTNNDFAWQRSYYDRIIRDEKELQTKRLYIQYNPIKWDEDRNNPNNFTIKQPNLMPTKSVPSRP